MSNNSTQKANNGLNKEWWPSHTLINKMCEIVNMRNIVVFKLKPCWVRITEKQDFLNISKGIFEYQIPGIFEVLNLLFMFEVLETIRYWIEAKVH